MLPSRYHRRYYRTPPYRLSYLFVLAIARPASSIPGAAPGRFAHVSADGPLRRKAADSRLIHLLFASAPDPLERFRVNFELLASPGRPLTHIEFYFMPAASVESAAVLIVRPRPVIVAYKSNDRLSGSLIFFRHGRRNLSREARIERIFQRMTDVTAEMIERGCTGDPGAAVREAREKLTSSASGQCGFDVELLRLFAKGYRSSGPAMAVYARCPPRPPPHGSPRTQS